MGRLSSALAFAAVAGAVNALGAPGRDVWSRGVTPVFMPWIPRLPPAKRRGYYAPNQAREVARRQRQIAAGTLKVTHSETVPPWAQPFGGQA
jgi:hypothetical protein